MGLDGRSGFVVADSFGYCHGNSIVYPRNHSEKSHCVDPGRGVELTQNKVLLQFQSVSRFFPPDVYAVNDLSFSIGSGTWTLVKGPSGSGKSTLLHLAAGLDKPTQGSIHFGDIELSRISPQDRAKVRRIKMGIIFQQPFLVPYLNALENVLLAQYLHSSTDVAQAKRCLAQVGLSHRLKHTPSELSGGEKQRLCVARSIINSPVLLLADEPTASLDEVNQKQILELLAELNGEGLTIVMTSHDPAIDRFAQNVLTLRFGKVLET